MLVNANTVMLEKHNSVNRGTVNLPLQTDRPSPGLPVPNTFTGSCTIFAFYCLQKTTCKLESSYLDTLYIIF